MFKDGKVINPLNDFIFSLPREKCGDMELDWMLKNLQANFYKLYGCSINLVQVQRDYLQKHEQAKTLNLQTFSVNSVEYFFIKINSIFEICFRIYYRLCEPKKPKGKEKHKFLEEQFAKYNEDTDRNLHIRWYDSVNRVRNFIVHGGYSIKTFVENKRFLFQAYDSDLNEQLREDFGFFKNDSPLIYADLYTNFHTSMSHWYIEQFFHFILHSMNVRLMKDEDFDALELQQKRSSSALHIGDEDLFMATSKLIGG